MAQPAPPEAGARPAAGRRPFPVARLLLLAAAVCAAVTTEMLPVGLLPSISAGLHVSESQVGLLVSGYAAVVAVTSIPLAAALQRLPRRPVLVVLLAAYGISNAVFALSSSYGLALGARLVAGLAHAAFFAVVVSAAVALVPREKAGRAVAVVLSGATVALAAGVPAGTALGTVLGWRWVFAGSAVLLLLLAGAVARLLPATPPAAAGGPTVLAALRQRRLLIIAAVIALFMIGHFTVYTYISPLLLYAGVSRAGVSAALLGYGAAGLLRPGPGRQRRGPPSARCPQPDHGADGGLPGRAVARPRHGADRHHRGHLGHDLRRLPDADPGLGPGGGPGRARRRPGRGQRHDQRRHLGGCPDRRP